MLAKSAPRDSHVARTLGLALTGIVIFSDALERPYGEHHQSELCRLLAWASFDRIACTDINMADVLRGGGGGVAGGNLVRLLVYRKPVGAVPSASMPRGRKRGGATG